MIGLLFWLSVGTILYTYAGYPIIIALLAHLRKPKSYSSHTPTVTLLITAFHEESVITDKLQNSLALEYPAEHLQILVAVDGADDNTYVKVAEYAQDGVELSFSLERRGKMAAINRAIPLARGEIVVFSDANNFYDRCALRELVAPFSDPSVGAVTGAKRLEQGDGMLGESDGLYWKYESFIKEQETRLGCATGVSGEILAVRRSLFEQPPDRIINDDFYLAMSVIRRGYRVVYAPGARSYERVSASAQDEVARRSRIVAGRYQAIVLARDLLPFAQPLLVWQVISHKFLRPLVPFGMFGALLMNLIAVASPKRKGGRWLNLAPPLGSILLVLQVVFYGLAVMGNMFEQGRGRRMKLPFYLYLPAFLLNSNLAALIGLYRFLTGRQSTLWQRVRRMENMSNGR